jgi:N-acetylated-alpha-linked acidic dipeptidase
MVMRLSTTPVLSSFRFKEYGLALERYAKDFGKTLEKENPYKDQVSLTPLIEAVSAYKDAASVIDQEIESSLSSHPRASWNWKQDCALRLQGDINGISKCDWASKDEEKEDDMSFLNDRIQKAERGFLDPLGLPGRPWYKHLVYAPDEWAGYKAEMFPTLRDTLITQGNLTLFNEALGNLTTRIHIAAQSLLPPPVF